jgi:thermitase
MNSQPSLQTRPSSLWLSILIAAAIAALSCTASAAPGKTQDAERGLLVKTRKNAASDSEVASEVANGGGRRVSKLDQLDVHVVRVPAEKYAKLKEKLSKNPKYEYVEEDAQGMGLWTPNDSSFGGQWHLSKIAAPAAWDVTTGSNTVIIAVLDTGIQMNHPDLQGRILPGWDYVNNDSDPSDDHGHGTAVAGAAAAIGNNSIGVTGVAVNAKILPFKVLNASNYGYYSAWSSAIMKAADQGARVISLSLGGTTSSSTLQSAVTYAWGKGSIVVVAAGNSGSSAPTYPAACTNALAVSATNSSDARTSWSNYGSYVRISAPGEGILTTHLGGGYASWSGTSFSTPVVSGVAALIAAHRPELSNTDIVNAILQGADDLGTAGRDDFYGYGRVNAARALQVAGGTTTSDTTAPVAALSIPDAVSTLAGTVMVYGDASDNVGVSRIEVLVNGTKVAQSSTNSIDYSWDTKSVSNATHKVKIVAYDAAGNAGSKEQTVSVNNTTTSVVTTDTTKPVTVITSPITGSTLGKKATIKVSATDNVKVVRVDVFADGKLVGSATTSTASVSWNTAKLSNGSHTITSIAYDAAGNAGAAAAVTVTK